jgi:hypothetical protein
VCTAAGEREGPPAGGGKAEERAEARLPTARVRERKLSGEKCICKKTAQRGVSCGGVTVSDFFFFLNGKRFSKDPYILKKRPPEEIKIHTSPVKMQEGP